LFDKSRYPTLESVRNRLNTVYASAAREGMQSMDEVVSKFADNVAFTGSVVFEWSPSMVPGSVFEFKKPFVISLGAFAASDPSFTVSFTYSHFTAGYMGSGVAYMGYVRYLREYYWVSTDMTQIGLSLVPNYVSEGVRYAALVIPVFMEYVDAHMAFLRAHGFINRCQLLGRHARGSGYSILQDPTGIHPIPVGDLLLQR